MFGLILYWLGGNHFPESFPGAPTWQHWTAGTIGTFLFFASVLAHEIAHSLMARHDNVKVSRITLFVFGGVAQSEGEPKTALSELWIAIVGPLSSVAIAGVSYAIWWLLAQTPVSAIWAGIFRFNAGFNLALAVFNILPAFPLDGGRVLRSCLWYLTGDIVKSTRVATWLGQGLGFLLAFMGLSSLIGGDAMGLYFLALGALLAMIATGSYQNVRLEATLQGWKVAHFTRTAPVYLDVQWPVQHALDTYFMPYRLTALPVAHDGRVVGNLTLKEIQRVDAGNLPYVTVGQIMSPLDIEGGTIAAGDEAIDAVRKMAVTSRDFLLVTDAEGVRGIISESDIAAMLRP